MPEPIPTNKSARPNAVKFQSILTGAIMVTQPGISYHQVLTAMDESGLTRRVVILNRDIIILVPVKGTSDIAVIEKLAEVVGECELDIAQWAIAVDLSWPTHRGV